MGLFERVTSTLTGGDELPEEAREALSEALRASDRDELVPAQATLEDLQRTHPRSLAVLTALGEVRARRGDDEGAVSAFGRAVDVSVDAVDAWLALGEALVRLRRGDPARDAFRRVLAAGGEPARRARAHAGRGRLELAEGRVAKAVRELRKAAELEPREVAIAADLGRALLAAHEPEGWQWLSRAAQGEVEAAGERDIDTALVIEAARQSPRRDPAIALLRSALEKIPAGSVRARARIEAALAEQLAEAGDPEPARSLAAGALAAAPDDVVVLAGWRAIAEASGQYPEALQATARMAELGAASPPERLVRLALGAQDRAALGRVAAALPADHPLLGPLAAFEAGNASEDQLVRLGALAPDEAARRFVAGAPAAVPPDGNLFALLELARDLAARTPALAPLLPAAVHAAEAYDRPLLIAVMGEFNAGKSSFVNAFCGAEVAPVGVTPTTATINVLRHGPPGGRVLYQDGRAEDLSAAAVPVFLGGLGADEAAAVRMVEIFFPLDVLRRVEIVDTPGLNSLRPEHERVARAFLTDADAIIWLFAVGQAAKASERDALGLAHDAEKRVLGVLNKADQADPAELARLLDYVRVTMSDRIEALLPLSARDAVRARLRDDAALLKKSGLPALTQALEERFFQEARTLKRQTALSALARFGSEARALLGSESADAESFQKGRQALAAQHLALDGALAAERVRLRAGLEQAFRQAAAEVLEFVRPRRWLFGERRAEAADEEFLFDLLEDAVTQATEAARARLDDSAAGGPPVPIAAAIERFRAYARGVLAGGLVARFLHEELPAAGGRVELIALQRALAGRVPDVDTELVVPLAAEVEAAHARAEEALAEEELRSAMRRLLREERVGKPLDALAAAVARWRTT